MNPIPSLTQHPQVQAALTAIAAENETLIELAIAIQQIPAPTFAERERANFVQAHLMRLGLVDITQDELGNVFARYPGQSPAAPPVIVTAHGDTVFPAETDLSIRREGALIYGPGISDNSAGVAGVLQLAALLLRFGLRPQADIWWVINVREEGLGDLDGMRAVTRRFPQAGAFIVVEGGAYGCILHEGIGVRRYRLEVKTAGGHSWSDFGRTSAIHVLGQLIAGISQLPVPTEPRTTYNVGVIEGGTSINTIAASARLLLDLRSYEPAELGRLIQAVEDIVAETRARSAAAISLTPIGDRPAGRLTREAPLVQWADAALRAVHTGDIAYLAGSTDANIPLNRGLPAVCIGLARGHHAHRLDEFLDVSDLPRGMQQFLLLTLAAAGFSV